MQGRTQEINWREKPHKIRSSVISPEEMKSPLRRLRGFGHHHPKERRGHEPPPAKLDELVCAAHVRTFHLLFVLPYWNF